MGFLLQRVNDDFLKKYFNKNEYFEYLENINYGKYINKEIYSKIKILNDYLKSKDFELFNFITENIISFDQENKNILKIYDDFFIYHQRILLIFFESFTQFEKLIKNKIINSINYLNVKSLYQLINIIIKDSKKNEKELKGFPKRCENILSYFCAPNLEEVREKIGIYNINEKDSFNMFYKKANKSEKRYFDYKLINEFSFSDISEFFEILKKQNYKNYLNIRDFIKDLLGEKKYNKFYEDNQSDNGIKPIIDWFLSNYKNVKILRNKIMHNKVLFANIKELNNGINSLLKLSNQKKNNIGDITLKKFLKETLSILGKIKQEKARKFFKEKIINLEDKN
ncbi:hypothetical protein X271_00052 [Candidatus Hepatoplasma crinochetorum Av]|uniref:Uncharacterized protein n=2 Tax=Candidatus Hepatoplasma crinochetorum TaxID=295596 RepID=W8GED4_9MOLU|nr:hypothetical protein X271_00052 [Candidatus Hepatoplasma crinochetorum Av]BDV02755.1 MAG: hypothetical protein HCTKY_0490 [Candidatus Hepatoplasma crinochetorum]